MYRYLCLVPLALFAGLHTAAATGAEARAPGTCAGNATPLHVAVDGLRNANGNLTVTVYGDRPEDFLASGRKLARVRVPVTGARTSACLPLPKAGTYAVAIYHDEDDDHDFDRTLIGLPDEGYGFSNDAPTFIGLPSFDDARVEVPAGGRRLDIRIRY